MRRTLLQSALLIAVITMLVGCDRTDVSRNDNEASDNRAGKTPAEIRKELKLPVDRPLSYEEALSLRASNISLINEDEYKLALLEQYAKDPNELNARYVWAVYQTWHEQEQDITNSGYQTIYNLAKQGHPYACADVYVWSVNYSDEFFKDVLKVSKKEILEIQEFCFEKALEINANEIKQVYIEDFFSDHINDNDVKKLSPQLMQNADRARLNKVKEYLLDYLFYWTNDFYGNVPSNNLAELRKAYQYLQILLYDPYGFDAIEACAWLKYFQEDILPYIEEHDLPDTIVWEDNLVPLMNNIEKKLRNVQLDQQRCHDRYLEIRDTPRDSEAKSRNFY